MKTGQQNILSLILTILIIGAFTSQTAIRTETEAEQHRPDPNTW